jgi:hypothetical protein
MPETSPKRFISIRLSPAEFKEVHRRVERTTCNSLTEYVKKVITGKPVTVKVRNESQDQLRQEIIHVKNQLTQLADTAERTNNHTLLVEIAEIKSTVLQIAKKWLPS